MSDFLSAIVTVTGEVICKPDVTDSYADLMDFAGLRDVGERNFTCIKFMLSLLDILDPSRWNLTSEFNTPEWFDHDSVRNAMIVKVRSIHFKTQKKK